MENKYYGIYADNGLGVYVCKEALERDKENMKNAHVQEFTNPFEAEDYAQDGFSEINGENTLWATVNSGEDDRMETDHFYKRKWHIEVGDSEIEEFTNVICEMVNNVVAQVLNAKKDSVESST